MTSKKYTDAEIEKFIGIHLSRGNSVAYALRYLLNRVKELENERITK